MRLPRSWKLSDGRKLSEVIQQTKDFERVWILSVNGKRRNTYYYNYLPCQLKPDIEQGHGIKKRE